MPTYDQTTATCFVFTFKEGLLSKIAHDLKIRVGTFSLNIDPDADGSIAMVAEFDARSLVVVNAMKQGREQPASLSESDKLKIAAQITDEVLHANRHPTVRFVSSKITAHDDGSHDIRGDLSLHGTTRSIRAQSRREGQHHVSEVTIHQPDYGIKPYKAMMGTLKVQADVRVRLEVPV